MRRSSAHFFQSHTLRVCSLKTMLVFLAFVCIKISLIYPFLNSWKTRKQLSVKAERASKYGAFFSVTDKRKGKIAKSNRFHGKNLLNTAFFVWSHTLRVCSLSIKLVFIAFSSWKQILLTILPFSESPFKIMFVFLAFICIKISPIYPFLNSGKQANNFWWRLRGASKFGAVLHKKRSSVLDSSY